MRRALLPGLLAALLAVGMLAGLPVRASADGPTTFSNTASIAVPAAGSPQQIGPASPYPSEITVSDMTGAVTKVTVTFHGLDFPSAAGDMDALLVAPTGANLVVMSDAGPQNSVVSADNATVTFDDAASGQLTSAVITPGSYRPTNNDYEPADSFPAPAPTPSSNQTLAQAFTGMASANGTWRLYIVDDTTGDTGEISGGWSLTITTETAAVATTTTVVSSDTTSFTGDLVTFTATVRTTGDAPVGSGTVQFADGTTNLGVPVEVDASGQASLTIGTLSEGAHVIRATYSGATGFLTSSGTVNQRVDNRTVVTDTTFCNTGVISLPDVGQASPYPSNIFVSGLTGQITKVTATLRGVTHQASLDLDALLAGPTPTTNLFLLSDAGGNNNAVNNATLTFDDAATGSVPNPITSGTFRPTNIDDESNDAMPGGAPTPTNATTLATFNGGSPNGTWSLWTRDDASGDSGTIAGGWCLTITSQAPTVTVLSAVPSDSTYGQSVTFTATVTAGGDPVSSGGVQFRAGTTALGTPVDVDSNGVARYTTAALAVGSHTITADYGGTANLAASTDDLSYVVARVPTSTVLSSSANPSTVGQTVTFTATVTSGGDPVTGGSVIFSVDGADQPAVPVGTDGTATFSTGALAAGTHDIGAAYSGTTNLGTSSDEVAQRVDLVETTTELTSSPDQSQFGEPVTFTATVRAGAQPATGGTVQFSDDGTALGPPVPLAADGTATHTALSLSVGSHSITAVYSGTAAMAGSEDSLTYLVGQVPSVTTLASSANPVEFGTAVTFTATVTSGGQPVTGGTVQFQADGDDIGDPVPLVGGSAALTRTDLPAGTHSITASFTGTTEIAGSTSEALEQVIENAESTTVVVTSGTPSLVGDPVTFTATVTAAVPIPASGSVQFSEGAEPIGAPVPLTGGGTAELQVDDLPAGTHTITATYSGGTNVAGSFGTVEQTVNRLGTNTAVVTDGSPSEFGNSATFTVTVTGTGGAPIVDGEVTVSVDGTVVQPATELNDDGQATYTTDALAPGAHTIRADYLQNPIYDASFGEVPQQVIVVADAGGPYAIAEGGGLTLDGSNSSAGTFAWDVNGDGDFSDATGASPTLTWTELEALGITDGPTTHDVRVRVTVGAAAPVTSDPAVLTVANTAPISVLTGDLTATVDQLFTIKVGAEDPSSADMALLFTYTVDWGDGSPVERVIGPADPPVEHTYTAAGSYQATFTATDKDGDTGPGTEVVVVAERAAAKPTQPPTSTPSATPKPRKGGDQLASTGSPVGPGALVLGIGFLVAGSTMLLGSRRRRGAL